MKLLAYTEAVRSVFRNDKVPAVKRTKATLLQYWVAFARLITGLSLT